MNRKTLGVLAVGAFVTLVWSVRNSKEANRAASPSNLLVMSSSPPKNDVDGRSMVRAMRMITQLSPTRQSLAHVESRPLLPTSHSEVPVTPTIERTYAEIEKQWGPGYVTWLDGKLARRAAIASCGVEEPGAAKILIGSKVSADRKTQVSQTVQILTSYQGELDDIVTNCIRNAVLGISSDHVTATPDWVGPDMKKNFGQSDEDHEFDTIGFPVESDELYDVFSGESSAYSATRTKQEYGWK